MFIEQPPWLFRALYPQAIFRMDPNERAVYLTFDDGSNSLGTGSIGKASY